MLKYLAHYNIKGSKWGIRRFQNEDGSLTSAGKERYSKAAHITSKAAKGLRDAAKLNTGQKSKIKTKRYPDLTDQELRNRVNRLNLEKQYSDLSGDTKRVRSGSDWYHEAVQSAAIAASVASSAIGIYLTLKGKV